jgi:hypothetical protein
MFGAVVNFLLALAIVVRLMLSDDSLSFDYQFYLDFISEVRGETLTGFLTKAMSEFPYYPWGSFGRFEVGFAFLVYLFPSFLSAPIVYASIAGASLYIKLEVMRTMRVSPPMLILFFVFFVTLFEANALRAGLALTALMLAVVRLTRTPTLRGVIPYFVVAVSFHVSAIIPIALVILGTLTWRRRVGPKALAAMLLFGLVVPANLMSFASLFSGKIADYVVLADEFDLYTGASGLNLASLMCITFGLTLVGYMLARPDHERLASRPSLHVGLLLAYGAGALVLLSGALSIIGDRVWQLAFPIIWALVSQAHSTWPHSTLKLPFFDLRSSAGRGGVLISAGWLLLVGLLSFYIVVNILFRYPQSNFFSSIVGKKELIAPTAH